MPFTASSPIEPPGNRSGVTTKLSVVMATGWAADRDAGGVAERSPSSAARAEEQRREQAVDEPAAALPPAPCAISICGSRKRIAGAAAPADASPVRPGSGS